MRCPKGIRSMGSNDNRYMVSNIPAGKAKRKESLMQTFYETSGVHFLDWLTFAESANQNYFCYLFF